MGKLVYERQVLQLPKKPFLNHYSLCLTKQLHHPCNMYITPITPSLYKHDRLYSTVHTFMSGLYIQVTVELYCSISEFTVEYKTLH